MLLGFVAPGPGSTIERTLALLSGAFLVVVSALNKVVRNWFVGVGNRYTARRPPVDHELR